MPGASDPPATAYTVRPASALRVDGDHRRLPPGGGLHPQLDIVAATNAHNIVLEPIDREEEGRADYSGPLVSDVDFGAFSHSALVRIADEVCLQMHLLVLSFNLAVRARANGDAALEESIR